MKRKNGTLTAAAIALAMLCGAVLGYFSRGGESLPQAAMEAASGISAAASQIQKPKYLLSSYQGKLAVYIIGKKEPELIFDRYLHYLPDVDRVLLEKGIEVTEYSELLQLIEDYTS